MSKINLNDVMSNFDRFEKLNNVNESDKYVVSSDIGRPGIQLAGVASNYPSNRIQLFGSQEFSYLESINYDINALDLFFSEEIPVIIFSLNNEPSIEFLKKAEEYNIPVFRCKLSSSKIYALLYTFLEEVFAPSTQVHGVCLNVYGLGVLIKGGSGIGKSEVALELISKGHLLVADDAVVLKKLDENHLQATAPKLLKNRIEIRGVGIVNIEKLYGVTKVLDKTNLDLVIELKLFTGNEDRIGNVETYEEYLETRIPKIIIPIALGRSLSNLIDVAVANFNLKKQYNYDSAQEFINDLNSLLEENKNE